VTIRPITISSRVTDSRSGWAVTAERTEPNADHTRFPPRLERHRVPRQARVTST
jgi:hypothetical protein